MADKVLPQRVRRLSFPDSCLGTCLPVMVYISFILNVLPLPLQIRDLVPESQAYMDLLAFERKLDQTIARKRMEIQEAIKKPIMVSLHDNASLDIKEMLINHPCSFDYTFGYWMAGICVV